MKIENKFTTPLTGEIPADSRGPKSAGSSGQGVAAGGSVDVHLSDLASHLTTIQNQLASGEVVDPAKVAEIRQAIADGRFKINADAIADRLLDTVRELIEGYRKD